jgi:hypothetical protein
MNISHGMDVEEVEALGRLLQRNAELLRARVVEIANCLEPVRWEGPDAASFKQQWWPEHRVRLQQVAEELSYFGSSAWASSSQQRVASLDPSSPHPGGGAQMLIDDMAAGGSRGTTGGRPL